MFLASTCTSSAIGINPMNSPIFSFTRNQMKEAMKFDYSGIRALENEMVRIIAENKDALVSAWVAETGNLPSDSVI